MLNEHKVEEPSACSEGKTIYIVSHEDMHEQSQNLIYKLEKLIQIYWIKD